MEILDEDIEYVRKALAGADHAAKDWFETLVQQHGEFASKADELKETVTERDDLRGEVDELKEQVQSLETDRDDYTDGLADALLAVKYWMHDVLVMHRPMRDPRKILDLVERAIG